jgi:hypothetical protein
VPETIQFQSRVGPDGTLKLDVPLGPSEAGADVVVTIRRTQSQAAAGEVDWHRFVEETYGSCAALGVERAPQGDFERRETIE